MRRSLRAEGRVPRRARRRVVVFFCPTRTSSRNQTCIAFPPTPETGPNRQAAVRRGSYRACPGSTVQKEPPLFEFDAPKEIAVFLVRTADVTRPDAFHLKSEREFRETHEGRGIAVRTSDTAGRTAGRIFGPR